jgi:predicted RNA-binding protein with PIN domain
MPYLIDGHNLIGRLPGIQLSDIDDEEQLVARLLEFCRAGGKKVEVIFDRAAPGQAGVRTRGAVSVRFTPAGRTADDAILKRLRQLKRAARNWTVVSSDRQVQANAREAGAAVLSSDDFAARMAAQRSAAAEDPDVQVSADEVNEWLDLFGGDA